VVQIEAPGAGHGEDIGIAKTEAIHRDWRFAGDGDRRGEDGGREAEAGQWDQETLLAEFEGHKISFL
jgi:hypothetical protein